MQGRGMARPPSPRNLPVFQRAFATDVAREGYLALAGGRTGSAAHAATAGPRVARSASAGGSAPARPVATECR